jgi:heterodisulfide reductase subunit D
MTDLNFEAALNERTSEMLDACTRCGKCVEVCPSAQPANIKDAAPTDVIAGIIDFVSKGDGPDIARRWATSCTLSGACIEACDEGVNPRFLLAMARVAIRRRDVEPAQQRRDGVAKYRDTSREVTMLSRLQLEREALERLGQGSASQSAPDQTPDFIFYTGCNVLRTPHIALLALDIMDTIGITYQTMGGPSHCCGVMQLRAGDVEMSGRMGTNSIEKMSHSKTGQVLSWCPSCQVQFSETTLPALERQRGARPFEMTPFIAFLGTRLDQLRAACRQPVQLRVALHRHPGMPSVASAALAILQTIPGIQIVDLKQPAIGLQSSSLGVIADHKRELQRAVLQAAGDAGVDALVTLYHSDHRELCAHEFDWPFQIVNLMEILGQSMGLYRHDRYKELKIAQDADLIVSECSDMIAHHAIDPAQAREMIVKAMLGDQPLALGSGPLSSHVPGAHPPRA